MKLKLFNLRLMQADTTLQDQEAINTFMESVDVVKTSTQYVPDTPDFWSVLIFYNEKKDKPAKTKKPRISEADLTEDEAVLYSALRLWRRDRAEEMNLPEFMVLSNPPLIEVAHVRPRDAKTLNAIRGMTSDKMTKYADDILAIVGAF